MRGLKLYKKNLGIDLTQVASFTDAWIETRSKRRLLRIAAVASFTDAWIETISEGVIERPETSHLLQMRGLKLFLLIILKSISLVASFTDAWIETFDFK